MHFSVLLLSSLVVLLFCVGLPPPGPIPGMYFYFINEFKWVLMENVTTPVEGPTTE